VWPFLAGGCALLSEGVQQGAYPKGEAVMNKISMLKLSVVAAALVLTLAPTSAVHAQDLDEKARVEVPFAFEVGSVHFVPGSYSIGRLNGSTLYVHGAKHGAFASIHYGDNDKTIVANKVVFHRVGSQYFLSEVWSAGTTQHMVAYQSKVEKQALELAANHPAIQGTEVILAQATK
jgi:hypothetical protein